MVNVSKYKVKKRSTTDFIISAEGHVTEFGDKRNQLQTFLTIPQGGINKDTNIFLICLGFARAPNSLFFKKLRRALANTGNLAVMTIKYLGTDVAIDKALNIEFIQDDRTPERIERLDHSEELMSHYVANDPHSFVVKARGQDLSEVLVIRSITQMISKNSYVDYGYIQSIDIIQSILSVKHFLSLDRRKIFAFGSSLGGYVLHMASHFAPQLFTGLVDVSSQMDIDSSYFLKGELCRGIADDYNTSISLDLPSFYTKEGPYQLTTDHLEIRALTKREISSANRCYYIMFSGVTDLESPLQKKIDYFKALLIAGVNVDLIALSPKDLDHDIFNHTGHSLGCNYAKLILSIGPSLVSKPYAYQDENFTTTVNTSTHTHTLSFDGTSLQLTKMKRDHG